MSYWRFFGMIATSTIVMFGLMYVNSYAWEHLYYSESRVYMAVYMGATMAVIMLLFMLNMYSNRMVNIAIFAGSAVIFAGALFLFRSQDFIDDKAWMKAMIPHHSIAILTSRRAEITDPRVAKLAEEIVLAQNREISEMRFLVEDIERNGKAGADATLGKSNQQARVETVAEALATPVIAGIRPAPLTQAEITRALGRDATCRFERAVDADPILATVDGRGVAKISGSLIMLEGDRSMMETEGVRMTLTPPETNSGEGADLIFDLMTEPPLRVGFDGYWTCN
ncbi:MAG: DUF305 domain-containing protein [Marinobacter sp.]|uniref:DUF305 domain-containing protein n=1 Tax=Marinobacter sp. TaxID=50741 RepID=UPI001B670B06|nr:DUF305 domain-containing protein [Marinobacter sp.]MBQ0747214.1 DUF305 domain-containing protein [Marinobacter sp.]MBQ0815749.1 DUF305 domain-containing protein [Marinobacter sp.]|tara:strand:+ start:378 stop:1223 length:846 start_codon:yes stop_codon:yes gene_type:complete